MFLLGFQDACIPFKESILWINFNDYTHRTLVTRDYGVYKNAGGHIYSFIRGGNANNGAIGAPVSLNLDFNYYIDVSFRPSV